MVETKTPNGHLEINWPLGSLLQEQHRSSFTYFLLLLTKFCHPNLGSKNFACPARELRAKKRCRIIIFTHLFFIANCKVKSIHFWNSVFDFMKTRSFSWCQRGLAWKSLVKGPYFHKMKIVQTLFKKRMDFSVTSVVVLRISREVLSLFIHIYHIIFYYINLYSFILFIFIYIFIYYNYIFIFMEILKTLEIHNFLNRCSGPLCYS